MQHPIGFQDRYIADPGDWGIVRVCEERRGSLVVVDQ